ncbi:MAG: beta-mannosidase [Anaerocolumna sp.]|jgi:beta-mannosidase|nr:beta-mannosidase [Anaerocolumna sp.]
MTKDVQKVDISLNGQWNLYWCEIGKGELEHAIKNATTPCKVPGDVHTALVDAGIIKDPLIDMNSKNCKWLENYEFWFVKNFEIKKEEMTDKVMITFGGLDLTADIWVNGRYIGNHNNAFYEVSFDITDVIEVGHNTVVVRIDEGIEKVKNKPMELMGKMWNNDQPYRVWMRKPQFVYGWDWTIWLPTCGIWRDVTVSCYKKAYLVDAYVYEASSQDIVEGEAVTLSAEIRVDKIIKENYTLKCEIYSDERFETNDRKVIDCMIPVDCDVTTMSIKLDSVKLWWPNGCGRPYLYHIIFTLLDTNQNIIDRMERFHGIRAIEIRQEKLNEEEKGFTFMVNGEPIFCKGANHVPSDCLYGRITPERSKALIEKAADCNMNMIRVWGGGIYESEEFMSTCDKMGIMVWHDFMFACGYYPDHDSEFYTEIKKEATAAIIRLRNHTSLIGWSGNNEVQEMYLSAKKWNPEMPWYGRKLYEELLPSLVETYNKNVIYRESSPYGGKEPTDFEEGDQHIWHFTHRPNYEHYMDLWRFTDFNLKFLSEFGIIGAMSLTSIKKCISPEYQDVDSEVWFHHCNSSSEHKLLNMVVEKYFGDYHQFTLEEYVLRSQVIQAEIIRHIYDEFRARKFVCSGLLFWTLGDSYGINNWSIIDYYMDEKPIYYYLRRSMSPITCAIRGYEVQNFEGMLQYRNHFLGEPEPLTLWAINDTLTDVEIKMDYVIMTFTGEKLKEDSFIGKVASNASEKVMTIDLKGCIKEPENTILYTRIMSDGALINENRYFFAPYKDLKLTKAKVTCSISKQRNDLLEIELNSNRFVWMLHLEKVDGVDYSDNDFDLFPGQKKVIVVKTESNESFIPYIRSLNPSLDINLLMRVSK